jgi:putative oxidoreductase
LESGLPKKNTYLIIGGFFCLCFTVFQLSAIVWTRDMLVYFGGPVKMQSENPYGYILLCIFIALLVAAAGLYSFSGAGKFRHLPLLKTMLIIITVVFILRGMMIVSDIIIINQHPELNLIRFVVYSLISLVIGIIYLVGLIKLFRQNKIESIPKTKNFRHI